MAQFLDLRTSENSNTNGFPSTALSNNPANPSFIGDLGLIVGTATNVRVDLWGTMGVINGEANASILLFVARNLNPTSTFVAANVIYTAEVTFQSGDPGPHVITINAADLNGLPGPIPGQINYSLFAANALTSTVNRSGPEAFTGIAVTG